MTILRPREEMRAITADEFRVHKLYYYNFFKFYVLLLLLFVLCFYVATSY